MLYVLLRRDSTTLPKQAFEYLISRQCVLLSIYLWILANLSVVSAEHDLLNAEIQSHV